MKKTNKLFGLIVFMILIGLFSTGCGSLSSSVRTDGDLSSVRPGGTLRFNSSGNGVIWTVSSTIDGSGPVTAGTNITPGGVLTVSVNEINPILYVIATSIDDGKTDIKQIRVTIVTGVAVTPSNQSIRIGRALQLNAVVSGSNNPDNTVTWKVSSNSAGTGFVAPGTSIGASGLLTVADNETLSTLYVIATSAVDLSKSGITQVYVITPIITGVDVRPPNQIMSSGSSFRFTAMVTGTNEPDNIVTWRVGSNPAGTRFVTSGTGISADGVLTVAVNETLSTLYVIATSVADNSKSGSSVVTIVRGNNPGQGYIHPEHDHGGPGKDKNNHGQNPNPPGQNDGGPGKDKDDHGKDDHGKDQNRPGQNNDGKGKDKNDHGKDQNRPGQNDGGKGKDKNDHGQDQNRPEQNNDGKGKDQSSQGKDQSRPEQNNDTGQGKGQNSQGQNQDSQGKGQNSQGQNQGDQGKNQSRQEQNQNSQEKGQNSKGQNRR